VSKDNSAYDFFVNALLGPRLDRLQTTICHDSGFSILAGSGVFPVQHSGFRGACSLQDRTFRNWFKNNVIMGAAEVEEPNAIFVALVLGRLAYPRIQCLE